MEMDYRFTDSLSVQLGSNQGFIPCLRVLVRSLAQAWDKDSPLVLEDEDEDFQNCEAEDEDEDSVL